MPTGYNQSNQEAYPPEPITAKNDEVVSLCKVKRMNIRYSRNTHLHVTQSSEIALVDDDDDEKVYTIDYTLQMKHKKFRHRRVNFYWDEKETSLIK